MLLLHIYLSEYSLMYKYVYSSLCLSLEIIHDIRIMEIVYDYLCYLFLFAHLCNMFACMMK